MGNKTENGEIIINLRRVMQLLEERRNNATLYSGRHDVLARIMVSQATTSLASSANESSLSLGAFCLMVIICSAFLFFTISISVTVLCFVRKKKMSVDQLNRCELDSLYSASLNSFDLDENGQNSNFRRPSRFLPKSWSYISNLTTSTSIYTNLSSMDNKSLSFKNSNSKADIGNGNEESARAGKRKVCFLTPSHQRNLEPNSVKFEKNQAFPQVEVSSSDCKYPQLKLVPYHLFDIVTNPLKTTSQIRQTEV